jgi:hypothetical protein
VHNQLSQSEVNNASGQTYRRRQPLSAGDDSRIEVAELFRKPDASAYGDIDWDEIVAFVVGLIADWSARRSHSRAARANVHRLPRRCGCEVAIGKAVAAARYLALARRAARAVVSIGNRGGSTVALGTAIG